MPMMTLSKLALHVLCLLCSFNEVFIFTTLRAKEYACMCVCECARVCVCVCSVLFIEGAENEGPPLFMFDDSVLPGKHEAGRFDAR